MRMLYLHPFILWWTFGWFCLLAIVIGFCYKHECINIASRPHFSVLLGWYPEVELLNHMAIPVFIFSCITAILFSPIAAIPFCIPINGAQVLVSPYLFLFLLPVLLVLHSRNHYQIQCHEAFPQYFSESFIVLGFTLRSLIHFEIVSVCDVC